MAPSTPLLRCSFLLVPQFKKAIRSVCRGSPFEVREHAAEVGCSYSCLLVWSPAAAAA
jgi:hypothetical protein